MYSSLIVSRRWVEEWVYFYLRGCAFKKYHIYGKLSLISDNQPVYWRSFLAKPNLGDMILNKALYEWRSHNHARIAKLNTIFIFFYANIIACWLVWCWTATMAKVIWYKLEYVSIENSVFRAYLCWKRFLLSISCKSYDHRLLACDFGIYKNITALATIISFCNRFLSTDALWLISEAKHVQLGVIFKTYLNVTNTQRGAT